MGKARLKSSKLNPSIQKAIIFFIFQLKHVSSPYAREFLYSPNLPDLQTSKIPKSSKPLESFKNPAQFQKLKLKFKLQTSNFKLKISSPSCTILDQAVQPLRVDQAVQPTGVDQVVQPTRVDQSV